MTAATSRNAATGLVLMGGGARAAYQVGVLRALGRIRREVGAPRENPFGIIAGTSAGAINAAAIACQADRFDLAVAGLVNIWRHFTADQVYRADAFGVVRTGARWLTMLTMGWALARWRRASPRSLLDNSPLAELLAKVVAVDRLPALLNEGHLRALAVTASSYTSGNHVTFCQTAWPFEPWQRSQRIAMPAAIGVEHLLASAAIPFVFPATELAMGEQREWFGDGSMRQSAPLSPAVHLGAERVFVIGAGRLHEPPGQRRGDGDYPSLAQVAGHALSNIFLDALAVDIDRAQRINRTLDLLDPAVRARSPLRPVEIFVVAPSQRLDDIAARHIESLPRPVRSLLRGMGVSQASSTQPGGQGGAALASYLLFEQGFTRELIQLGMEDTLARRADILRFFDWPDVSLPDEQRDASPTHWGSLETPL